MVKIGMAGVGDISGIYLENITNMYEIIENSRLLHLSKP